jgi:hypothetical protein
MCSKPLVVVLALAVSVPASAQEVPAEPSPALSGVGAGQLIRVTDGVGRRIEGWLVGSDEKSLMLALPSAHPLAPPVRLKVPLRSVGRVELWTGRKHHLWIGALIGAVLIGATGFGEPIHPESCQMPGSSEFCSRGEAVAISALAGAFLGGTVGFLVKQDQWSPVVPEALVGPPRRESRGLAVGVTVRF